MTVDEEVDQTRHVLLGIRFDKESKELLCWALVRIAEPRDQVVAVHVCRNSEEASKKKMLLDGYLENYKGLCDMKKVKLSGQILTGKSIRKTLVKEAKNCAATAVIVGISHRCPIGAWASTARYCARHLPPSVEILTLHRGKIVFQRSSDDSPPGHRQGSKSSFHKPDAVVEPAENKHAIVEINKESPERSASLHSDSYIDKRPGWPLLLMASLPTQKALDARKMSVVQWAMSLPDRSSAEAHQSSSSFCSCMSESPRGRLHSSHGCQSVWSELLEEPRSPFESKSSDLTWFSYEVLSHATSQFSSDNLIGKGGYSQVYKGTFPDGKQVAVKVLKSSEQAWKDFSLEVNIVSSLRHKNITPLLGVCINNNELISVYGFMPKGSLEENLHGANKEKSTLRWETRFRVAVGIAEALEYLHNGCSRPIIHRDVKSSNILLSDDFEPQLSDFGLAIWGPDFSQSQLYTDVVGTFGYLAPEYLMYGKVTDKLDVYSFGVVLLELLSGRKPIESSKGQESLVIWGKPKLKSRKLTELVDPVLEEGSFKECQMRRMVLAAAFCLTRLPGLRPNMSQILRLLKGDEMTEAWAMYELDHTQSQNLIDIDNDDELYQLNSSVIKSKQNPKLLEVDRVDVDLEGDEIMSCSSVEPNNGLCVEDYLKARSRSRLSPSSSFH